MRSLEAGRIRNAPKLPLSECLRTIHARVAELIAQYSPDVVAGKAKLSQEHLWGPRERWFKDAYWTNAPTTFVSEMGCHGCPSLESLNLLGKSLEDSPIVNSCAIITANKAGQRQVTGEVLAKLIVYLQKPAEEVKAP